MESFKSQLAGPLYQFYPVLAIHRRYSELDAPVANWTEVMMQAITCLLACLFFKSVLSY